MSSENAEGSPRHSDVFIQRLLSAQILRLEQSGFRRLEVVPLVSEYDGVQLGHENSNQHLLVSSFGF
jgi:hypothetical protein